MNAIILLSTELQLIIPTMDHVHGHRHKSTEGTGHTVDNRRKVLSSLGYLIRSSIFRVHKFEKKEKEKEEDRRSKTTPCWTPGPQVPNSEL